MTAGAEPYVRCGTCGAEAHVTSVHAQRARDGVLTGPVVGIHARCRNCGAEAQRNRHGYFPIKEGKLPEDNPKADG